MAKNIVIIGGGVIGYCTAYYLAQSGHKVTILEKSMERDGCSYGNAGMIVPSHFIPFVAPGIIKKGLKWMLKRDSPFSIKPRLNLDLFRWVWHVYNNANKSHVKHTAPILASLSQWSRELFSDLNNSLPDDFDFKEKGLLMLYKSAEAEAEEIETAELAGKLGIKTQVLTNEELSQLDGGAEYNVRGAVYYPNDAFLDPMRFMISLEKSLLQMGVTIENGCVVNRVSSDHKVVRSVATNKGEYEADEFVLCAGIYSSLLAKSLGLNLPMQGGKGYSITLENPGPLPEICSILLEARVAITPIGNSLRLAGTMEIAVLDFKISRKRVEGYLKSVQNYLPDYKYSDLENGQVWVGLRPCSPDGLPFIGRTSKFSNLLVGTGHAMLGLSLAPATGKLLTDIINEEAISLDINHFSPDRFN